MSTEELTSYPLSAGSGFTALGSASKSGPGDGFLSTGEGFLKMSAVRLRLTGATGKSAVRPDGSEGSRLGTLSLVSRLSLLSRRSLGGSENRHAGERLQMQ